MSNPKLIEFNGKIASISEHCRDIGANIKSIYIRKKKTGKSIIELLTEFLEHGDTRNVRFNGKIQPLKDHCKDLGMSYATLYAYREKTGKSTLECLQHYLEVGVNSPINHPKDKRFYEIWSNMLKRCFNKNHKMYKYYGGKGITVCERWLKYEYFEEDMYNAYLWHVTKYGEKDTTLDRIKGNRNYMPNNCRWATRREQAINRKQKECDIILPTGETVTELSKRTGVPKTVIFNRYKLGWSIEKIIATPIKKYTHYYLPCGILLRHHCLKNKYVYVTIVGYIKQYDLSPDQALAKYLEKRKKK